MTTPEIIAARLESYEQVALVTIPDMGRDSVRDVLRGPDYEWTAHSLLIKRPMTIKCAMLVMHAARFRILDTQLGRAHGGTFLLYDAEHYDDIIKRYGAQGVQA